MGLLPCNAKLPLARSRPSPAGRKEHHRTGSDYPSRALCATSSRAHGVEVLPQDEIQAKEDEEAKAKADAEAEDSSEEGESLASKLIGHLEGLFDMPALAPHKKHVQPLFDLLEQHEMLIFGILAAPLLLLLASFGLLGGAKVRAHSLAHNRA